MLFLAVGRERVEIEEILHTEPFVKVRVNVVSGDNEDPVGNSEMDLEVEALVRSNDEMFPAHRSDVITLPRGIRQPNENND